jgi:hypothetical protein
MTAKTYDGKTNGKNLRRTTAKQQRNKKSSNDKGVTAGLMVFTPSVVVTSNVSDGWSSRAFVAGVR